MQNVGMGYHALKWLYHVRLNHFNAIYVHLIQESRVIIFRFKVEIYEVLTQTQNMGATRTQDNNSLKSRTHGYGYKILKYV